MKLAIALVLLAGCDISRPIQDQHPTVQRAPASADDSLEARRDALQRTVAIDLGCNQGVEIVLTLERRYANTAAPRYVVEACGTRALYAETCESWPSCRYVLLSTVQLVTSVPVPSVVPSTPAPTPSAAPEPTLTPDAGASPPKFL